MKEQKPIIDYMARDVSLAALIIGILAIIGLLIHIGGYI